ncbi:MAG: hypothetical protein DRQ48_06035 [Gammaproteobacteria bacterium]|nr:MAG: hypothetical protein DRQ58_02380 [Gammaproteobacteria bacterium]RKZ70637.1 MAG: hypothetical protein DRQ48_06035 [Gammaproteobacteria bacterium]
MIKTVRNILIASLIVLGIAGLFVTGDYFGVFGLKKYLVLDFAESSFRPVDKETGAPVIDVKIRCFQKGNNNACTQKESRASGIIIVRVPVQKLVWESLLFKNKEELVATNDPQLHIMFIHYNYNNPVATFSIEGLYNDPVSKYSIKMERKFKEAEDE